MTVRACEQGTVRDDAPSAADFALVVRELNGLIPTAYDYIELSYTGDDVTGVVYMVGGAGGTVVATLVLTYAAPGVLSTVTRT